jgi:hypothetical protein
MQKKYILFFLFLISQRVFSQNEHEIVTVAILAKDKAHTLDLYLKCLERQTWPKSKTFLYVRTNNNTDNTAQILKDWIAKVKNEYAEIFFDDTDVVEPVQNYRQHEWNCMRFKVLGKIRQESVKWAQNRNSHYFVADCDNFIKPHVIESLVRANLLIIAPFLRKANSYYSNYHAAVDMNGYFEGVPLYYDIYDQKIVGLIEVPVVHCTYLIRKEILHTVCYDDESYRYEYVIFSDLARKNRIPQYIDNREVYGYITMAEDRENIIREPWFIEVLNY